MPRNVPLDALAFLVDDDGRPPCSEPGCGVCRLLGPLTPALVAQMRAEYTADSAGLPGHWERPKRMTA
jgi:hypothetical protein